MWTVDFFKNNLLGWIREHGGWVRSRFITAFFQSTFLVHVGSFRRGCVCVCWQINSFSELAVSSMQGVSMMSSHAYISVAVIFLAGLAFGSIITWKLSRGSWATHTHMISVWAAIVFREPVLTNHVVIDRTTIPVLHGALGKKSRFYDIVLLHGNYYSYYQLKWHEEVRGTWNIV